MFSFDQGSRQANRSFQFFAFLFSIHFPVSSLSLQQTTCSSLSQTLPSSPGDHTNISLQNVFPQLITSSQPTTLTGILCSSKETQAKDAGLLMTNLCFSILFPTQSPSLIPSSIPNLLLKSKSPLPPSLQVHTDL